MVAICQENNKQNFESRGEPHSAKRKGQGARSREQGETAKRKALSAEHKKNADRIAQSAPTAVCAPLDLTQEALLESVQEQPLG